MTPQNLPKGMTQKKRSIKRLNLGLVYVLKIPIIYPIIQKDPGLISQSGFRLSQD